MPPQDLSTPHETPRDTIEILQDNAIGVQDALLIAAEAKFPLGKSTLQRWSKTWADLGSASPVKSILVTNRYGTTYRLDRDDFKSWVFEQKQNMRPGETLRDPVKSHETSQDIKRPHQTSRDFERHQEDGPTGGPDESKMRDENMQLKIDVEVRKQLLNQAAGEINRQRGQIESLLRENGALSHQILQLAAPRPEPERRLTPPDDIGIQEWQGNEPGTDGDKHREGETNPL